MCKAKRVLLALAAALAFAAGLSACSGLEELAGMVVQDVPLSAVADGTYRGAQRNFPVTAGVEVTVQAGRITDIRLHRHFHGPGHGAEEILPRVLSAQSLQVDAISGATYSSKVVLKAIETALRTGM